VVVAKPLDKPPPETPPLQAVYLAVLSAKQLMASMSESLRRSDSGTGDAARELNALGLPPSPQPLPPRARGPALDIGIDDLPAPSDGLPTGYLGGRLTIRGRNCGSAKAAGTGVVDNDAAAPHLPPPPPKEETEDGEGEE
jgi:hypothetical protein